MLQALYNLARDENLVPDPDFEMKPVAWIVRVGPGGKLLGIEDTRYIPESDSPKRKPKPVAKFFRVPRESGRTSGARAFFLFDKAEYVFGADPTGEREAGQLQERRQLFLDKAKACLAATADEGVAAVVDMLEKSATGQQPLALPETCAANDLFAFVYQPDVDMLVTDRPKVKEYWRGQRRDEACAEAPTAVCLVSGKPCVPVDKHPPLKNVPGGTSSGVALVSFNSSAFESYGWNRNDNAPISREAAEACATALNRLLHPAPPDPNNPGQTLPRRNLRLTADTVVCYWSRDQGAKDFLDSLDGLFEGNPDQVKRLYLSLWTGQAPAQQDLSPFYALTLSGAQGRAIVRGWFESTVGDVARNMARHFVDLDMVRITPKPKKGNLPPVLPLNALLESIAPLGKRDEIPAALAHGLIGAAFRGGPYPLGLLQRAVERARAEIGQNEWADLLRRDARAALIKAVLNRRRSVSSGPYQEVRRDMDPNNRNEGYLLGRLLAVIERIQQEALADVNASVVDRYFSGASACPKAVFVRLLKNSMHHARKARDDKKRAGFVLWLSRIKDEIADRFDPKENGFPAHLSLDEQGLFVLGYHQMRRWLWMNKDERAQWQNQYLDAPAVYLTRAEEETN